MERMRDGGKAALWHKAGEDASCCSMRKEQERRRKDKNDKVAKRYKKATMLVLRIVAV